MGANLPQDDHIASVVGVVMLIFFLFAILLMSTILDLVHGETLEHETSSRWAHVFRSIVMIMGR